MPQVYVEQNKAIQLWTSKLLLPVNTRLLVNTSLS